MTAAVATPHTARVLGTELAALKLRLDTLESGVRADQLGQSSIENGHLAIYDETGTLRSRIGRQHDGTFVGGVSVNNTAAPPIPRRPSVQGVLAGVQITGNGASTGAWPADFAHYNIYASGLGGTALVGTLLNDLDVYMHPVPTGTTVLVWLTAVNSSGTESEPSATVSALAGQVLSDDIMDGAVGTLQLAEEAVQAANLAVGSVTGTVIAPGSIDTPHLVAGAVDTGALAANAVAAGTVAADAITAREVVAGSLTGAELAVGTITTANIQAGAINAGQLAADLVLATRLIVGSAGGDRLELHPVSGLQGWKDGVRTLHFDVGSGNLTAIGQWQTGISGERLTINTDGSMSFYDSNNNISAILDNAGVSGVMLSAGTTGSRGSMSVQAGGSHLFWGNPGAPVVNSDVYVIEDEIGLRGPIAMLAVDRRFGFAQTHHPLQPQIIFRQLDGAGNSYNSEVCLIQGLIGGTNGYAPAGTNQEQMFRWNFCDMVLSATSDIDGGGTDALYVRNFAASPRPIAASAHLTWSSVDRKAEVTPFDPGPVDPAPVRTAASGQRPGGGHAPARPGPAVERLFAAFEAAPAYSWRYKQPGDLIDENDPSQGVIEDVQPPPLNPDLPPRPPRREPMHLFPLAEQLRAVAPELVMGPPGSDQMVDLRDMIGWLWATCGRLHARVAELEAAAR